MPGKPVGTAFAELDLDLTPFERKLKTAYDKTIEGTQKFEQTFKQLGISSDRLIESQRQMAIASYEAIANSAKSSANDIIRAEEAKNARLLALENQRNSTMLGSWNNLGIKSQASIEAQKAAIISSFDAIKNSSVSTSDDIVRAEIAKNEKLKSLQNELYGHHKTLFEKIVGDHEASVAGMMRALLRLYAAYYVVSSAAQVIVQPFVKGFQAVEEYNQSVASMAAMVMTFAEKQKEVSMADQWRDALKYSTAIVPVLENIAAKTLLSGQETTALANAFARSGVFLDATNQRQIESFTMISNALPLMTQGQEIMRQINTEIRSLMTGSNAASSMLLTTLKSIDPEIKEHLKTWREQGTVLENIGDLLVGFGPATSLLENQWEAVKSTLDTTATQTLRGGMTSAYQDIIKSAQDLNKISEDQKETIQKGIHGGWLTIKGILEIIWQVARPFVPYLKDAWDIISLISKGLGLIAYAVLPPIIERVSDIVTSFTTASNILADFGKILFNVVTFRPTALKEAVADLKADIVNAGKNMGHAFSSGLIDEVTKRADEFDKAFNASVTPDKPPKAGVSLVEDAKKEAAIQNQVLQSLAKQYTETYNTAIKAAESVAKKQQEAGQYELTTIDELYNAKQKALNNWYYSEVNVIERQIRDERIKNQKLETLHAEYLKKSQEHENKRDTSIIAFNKKHIEIEADLYKTINQYSDESVEAEIARIELKYRQAARWTDNEILLEQAKAEEIRRVYSKIDKARLDYYQKTEVYASDSAEVIGKLAQDEYDQALKVTDNILVAEKAKRDFIIESNSEMARSTGDMLQTMSASWDQFYDDQLNVSRTMYDGWSEANNAILDDGTQVLKEGLKGNFDDIGDAWDDLMYHMKDIFYETVARIAMQKIMINFGSPVLNGVTSAVTGATGSFLSSTGLSALFSSAPAVGVAGQNSTFWEAGAASSGLGSLVAPLAGIAAGMYGMYEMQKQFNADDSWKNVLKTFAANPIQGSVNAVLKVLGLSGGGKKAEWYGLTVHDITDEGVIMSSKARKGSNYDYAPGTSNIYELTASTAALKEYYAVLESYPSWVLDKEKEQLNSSIMEQYNYIEGKTKWYEDLKKNVDAALAASLTEGLEEYESQINEYYSQLGEQAGSMFASAMGTAMQSGSFNTFFDAFKQQMLSVYQDSLVSGFTSSAAYQNIMGPFLDALNTSMSAAQGSSGVWSPTAFQQSITPILNQTLQKLEDMVPAFKAIYDALGGIDVALSGGKAAQIESIFASMDTYIDSLTAAMSPLDSEIKQITDTFEPWLEQLYAIGASGDQINDATNEMMNAIDLVAQKYRENAQSMVDDFLASMSTSDLAPTVSKEAYDRRIQELMSSAQSGDTEALSDLFNFVKSEYLPFYKSYAGAGSDYNEIYQSLFGVNGILANYQVQAPTITIDTRNIGEAIKEAFSSITQEGTYTFNLKIDNSTLATSTVQIIRNSPEVREEIRLIG
jgi:uncharacterized protein YihD (DUF1040 family)